MSGLASGPDHGTRVAPRTEHTLASPCPQTDLRDDASHPVPCRIHKFFIIHRLNERPSTPRHTHPRIESISKIPGLPHPQISFIKKSIHQISGSEYAANQGALIIQPTYKSFPGSRVGHSLREFLDPQLLLPPTAHNHIKRTRSPVAGGVEVAVAMEVVGCAVRDGLLRIFRFSLSITVPDRELPAQYGP